MENKKQITEELKKTIFAFLPDAEVLLFGSRARNEGSVDSDYDILLITNKNFSQKEKLSLRTEIRKALFPFGIRSDILIQSKSEVETKKKLPGHIVRKILREAILL